MSQTPRSMPITLGLCVWGVGWGQSNLLSVCVSVYMRVLYDRRVEVQYTIHMSVSPCWGHWMGWIQLQNGRSLDCVHAAGGTEDMDPVDCNGQTHIGRRVIHSSTNPNEPFTLCWNSYLAPSTVKSLDEFSRTRAFETLLLSSIPAEVTLARYCALCGSSGCTGICSTVRREM